jgi:hypothetical protein
MAGASCVLHPARPAARTLGTRSYCADCLRGLEAAGRTVSPLVQPRECFATVRGTAFAAPSGSPCAHWLAHELASLARPGRTACAAGFALEVADLLMTRRELERTLPGPRDLWVDLDNLGCGIVTEVRREDGGGIALSVRGLLAPGGRLDTVDFYRDLHGRGRFFR